MTKCDVVVIGSGPAGLQAALTLARGQRSVAVVEGLERRNARAHAIHNVITRDGVDPEAFRDAAWRDLRAYGVQRLPGEVTSITGGAGAFEVSVDGRILRARRLLLATGVRDVLPDWPGLGVLWGPTVFQCPFCHGHELRGLRWAVRLAGPESVPHLALYAAWTPHLLALTDGWEPDDAIRAVLRDRGVMLVTEPVAALEPRSDTPDRLAGVRIGDTLVPCDALVLHPTQHPAPLVEALGLTRDATGSIQLDPMGRTSAPGISAAGDATTRMQSAVAAMGSGQLAAAGLCFDLAAEDWG